MATARRLAEACLADPALSNVSALQFPTDPDDLFDWTEDSIQRERGLERAPVLTPGQRALVLAAFHSVYCPGCEPVVAVPDELPEVDAEGRVVGGDEYRRVLRWLAIEDAVRQLGDHAANWLRLLLRRIEQDLASISAQPVAPPDAERQPAARSEAPAADDDGREQTEAPPPPEAVLPEMLSASDLAGRLSQPPGRVESYLRKYRREHADCYVRVDNPRRNEPSYLYRTAVVWPALQAQLPRWRTLGQRHTPPTDG
jgi:hypothetical protein